MLWLVVLIIYLRVHIGDQICSIPMNSYFVVLVECVNIIFYEIRGLNKAANKISLLLVLHLNVFIVWILLLTKTWLTAVWNLYRYIYIVATIRFFYTASIERVMLVCWKIKQIFEGLLNE